MKHYELQASPAYSESTGTAKTCHCKRVLLYPMIFNIRTSFFGPKNDHCSRSTLTGVTVSGEACSMILAGTLSKDDVTEKHSRPHCMENKCFLQNYKLYHV